MTDPENLSKLCSIRKSHLRNITNVESEVLQLISNIDPKNENQKLKLLGEVMEMELDEEGEVMEMELDESLARCDNFHELFVKIDMCLKLVSAIFLKLFIHLV